MENSVFSRKRVGIFVIISITIAAVILSALLVIELTKNATMSVIVAPSSAKITLDGKEISRGSYKTWPKSGHLVIEANGYKTKEYDLEIKPHSNNIIHEYLEDEDGGLKSYLKSSSNYSILKLLAKDQQAYDLISEYNKAVKILYFTPFEEYRPVNNASLSQSVTGLTNTKIEDASSNSSCEAPICLKVSGKDTSKQRVKEILEEKGFNIDDYDIIYN